MIDLRNAQCPVEDHRFVNLSVEPATDGTHPAVAVPANISVVGKTVCRMRNGIGGAYHAATVLLVEDGLGGIHHQRYKSPLRIRNDQAAVVIEVDTVPMILKNVIAAQVLLDSQAAGACA